jgi:hypothetical protein
MLEPTIKVVQFHLSIVWRWQFLEVIKISDY